MRGNGAYRAFGAFGLKHMQPFSRTKLSCYIGSCIKHTCLFSTDVAWFRGPTLLEDNEADIEIQRHKDRHILRLYDIKKSSFYSCTALNAFGEASHQIRVTVEPGKFTL